MRTLFSGLLFIVFSLTAFSQSVTLYGYVSDKTTGEKLIGANVYDENKLIGTTSNNYGFYSIQVPKYDSIVLNVSYIGYKPIKRKVLLEKNTELNMMLDPGPELEEVVITATNPIYERAEISTHTIPIQEMKKLPAIGGETDLIKALQFLPGVQSGNEASSGLYVRGGSPDQNLILLDGVPLYYVNHLGGFLSVFNPDAIKSVSLIKGGFPARYGNRLSSVLDIRMNEGNMKEFKGSSTFGLISSKVCIEGPIIKDSSSYLISFRRFLYDIFSRPITYFATDGVTFGYNFYDFNLKVNYILSSKDRFYFSYYMGDDKFTFRTRNNDSEVKKAKSQLQWGNILATMRWNHVFSHKLFSNASLYSTRYRYQTIQDYLYTPDYSYAKFYSGIADVGTALEFEYFPTHYYQLHFGGTSVYHSFTPTVTRINESFEGISAKKKYTGYNPVVFETSAYIENQLELFKRMKLNIGGRLAMYSMTDTFFASTEPRLLLSYKISGNSAIKIAYSKMRQNIHLLTGEGTGMPVDYWVPVTKTLVPEKAGQFSLAYTVSTHKGLYEWSLEGFVKRMKNLISFEEGINYLGNSGEWQDKIETGGIGNSYGIELFVQKKYGKSTGWIGYTLAKAERQFERINNGKSYPFRYDRRNDISIVYNYKINDRVDISATWVYGTGSAITLASGHYYAIDDNDYVDEDNSENHRLYDAHIYGDKNSFRMRDYHRLDLGINFRKARKNGERIWNISIYNVYNRKNPFYYYWNVDSEYDNRFGLISRSEPKLYQMSLFPIIPSICYSFSF